MEGVARTTQAQSWAGSSQTLGAGVVVVQEALQGHGHVVKVVVVRLVPRLKIPLGNVLESVPTNVSPSQERDQVPPLEHLLLVLKVREVSRGAAHQLKAWEELVLPEKVQVSIQVGEIVAQSLSS